MEKRKKQQQEEHQITLTTKMDLNINEELMKKQGAEPIKVRDLLRSLTAMEMDDDVVIAKDGDLFRIRITADDKRNPESFYPPIFNKKNESSKRIIYLNEGDELKLKYNFAYKESKSFKIESMRLVEENN